MMITLKSNHGTSSIAYLDRSSIWIQNCAQSVNTVQEDIINYSTFVAECQSFLLFLELMFSFLLTPTPLLEL